MALLTELCPKCSAHCENDNENVDTDNTITEFYTCTCGCEFEREYTPEDIKITKEPD